MREIMGGILLVVLAVLFKAAVVAAAAVLESLRRERVEAIRLRLVARPGRILALGLIDALAAVVVFFFFVSISKQIHVAGFIALGWLAFVMWLTLHGLAGLYGAVGERLSSGDISAAKRIVRGGAALELATCVPLLGWLGHGALLCMALGAGALQMFAKADGDRGPAAAEEGSPAEDAEN